MFRNALHDLSSLKIEALTAITNHDNHRASLVFEIASWTLVRLRKYLPRGKDYRKLLGANGDLFDMAARFYLRQSDIPMALLVLEAVRTSAYAERFRINSVRFSKPLVISKDLEILEQIKQQIWQQEVNNKESSSLVLEHDKLTAKLFNQEPNLASDLVEKRQLEGLYEVCMNVLIYGVFDSFTFLVLKQPNENELKCWLIELGTEKIESLVKEYRAQLFQIDRHDVPCDEIFTRISRILTGDALDLIDSSLPLCFIPHGPMHKFPFSALRHNCSWLGGQVELFSVTSIPMLRKRNHHPRLSGRNVVALSYPGTPEAVNYLKGAAAELDVVHQVFPEATCRLGTDATPEAFYHLAPKADVLHVACHAFFDAESPLQSFLALAPEYTSSGKVTVAKIYELDLRASLVVLSGCQTSIGKYTPWDDAIGIAQGCLLAGAEAVIGGLWYLCDQSTLDLMTRFYMYVKKGKTFSRALFDSRRELIQRGGLPYEWSPFVLMGNGKGDWHLSSASRLRMTVR